MADYTLNVKMIGEASVLNKSLKEVQNKLGEVKNRTSKISDKMGAVGQTLTSRITKPAMIAAGALKGITLVKGFQRLVGIDEAKAKLLALGHDANGVEDIMKSALTSVKGTSFGMAEAATTAASAVAAGIKPGQELTKYLTLTGDAASVAGVSMSEMGSIFNKVQTNQAAYTEELNQLSDRGIPIIQYLAKETGKSTTEVKKMASEGKISAEMFRTAIENNMSGAAKTMGEASFMATIKNIGASLGRIGANFLDAGGKGEGFFSQLKPLLVQLKEKLGVLEDKAGEIGTKVGESFKKIIDKVKELKAKWNELSQPMQNLVKKAAIIGPGILVGIGPVLTVGSKISGAFSKVTGVFDKVSGVTKGLSGAFSALTGPMGIAIAIGAALAAGFIYLFSTNEEFRNSVMQMVTVLASSLGPIVQQIGAIIMELAQAVFPILLDFMMQMMPLIQMIVDVIAQFLPIIMQIIGMLVSTLAPVIQTIITLAMQLISAIMPVIVGLIRSIMGVIQSMMPVIMTIITVVTQVVTAVIAVVTPIIKFIADLIAKVISFITPIIEFIAGIIEEIMGIITPIIEFVMGIVEKIIEVIAPIVDTIGGFFKDIFRVVSSVFDTIVSAAMSLYEGIKTVVSPILEFFKGIFDGIWNAVKPVLDRVKEIFKTVFDAIKSSWEGLKGFVSGIFDGISAAFDAVVSTVKSVINGVIGAINGAIWAINLIPGVNISEIAYLRHGTDNWQGGFAYMNEGGRGELVHLPNGSVVVPHDISRVYAKESARQNRLYENDSHDSYQSINVSVTMDDVTIHDNRDIETIAKELGEHISREVAFA